MNINEIKGELWDYISGFNFDEEDIKSIVAGVCVGLIKIGEEETKAPGGALIAYRKCIDYGWAGYYLRSKRDRPSNLVLDTIFEACNRITPFSELLQDFEESFDRVFPHVDVLMEEIDHLYTYIAVALAFIWIATAPIIKTVENKTIFVRILFVAAVIIGVTLAIIHDIQNCIRSGL